MAISSMKDSLHLKSTLALALVFSLPVSPLNTGSMFVFQSEYQQEHVQGAINIPLKEVKERITAVPDKNDTVKVCNAGRQSGQSKRIAKLWDIPTLKTPVA